MPAITPQLVRALLAALSLNAPDDAIVPTPGGTVNQVARIRRTPGPDLFLRIGPSNDEVAAGPSWLTATGLQREQAAFARIPALAPLLPRTIHTDWSRSLIDADWVLQEAVPGVCWADHAPHFPPDHRQALWRQLGEITRRLHTTIGPAFGPPQPDQQLPRWSDLLQRDALGFRHDADRFRLDSAPFDALLAAIDHHRLAIDVVTRPALIHSDLDPRHVFIDPTSTPPRITGIIDWEFARFADPWSESTLVSHWLRMLPYAAGQPFLATYGPCPTDPAFAIRMNLYGATAFGWWVTDMARLGKPDRAASALASLTRLITDHLA